MSQSMRFLERFLQDLQVSASAQGLNWQCRYAELQAADASTASTSPSAIALRLRGEVQGQLFLLANEAASRMTFPNLASFSDEAVLPAWQELWGRMHTDLAKALNMSFADLQIEPARVASESSGAVPLGRMQLQTGGSEDPYLLLLGDAALKSSLEQETAATSAGEPYSLASMKPPLQEAPLQRVIDVPLAVTLRFGQRQLTLRELLDLNTGSLVELDQQVEEPVHLMLGNRVIARGEVVIIDGNYGMRVTEVMENPMRQLPSHR